MKAVLRNLHIPFPHFLARRQLTWTFAGGFLCAVTKMSHLQREWPPALSDLFF
jgi:hypothetical protein